MEPNAAIPHQVETRNWGARGKEGNRERLVTRGGKKSSDVGIFFPWAGLKEFIAFEFVRGHALKMAFPHTTTEKGSSMG